VIVDTALYVAGKRVDGPVDISEQVDIARAKDGFVWVGLAEPTKAEFDHIVGELNFHPLAVEDAVSAKQRPKIEDYEGLMVGARAWVGHRVLMVRGQSGTAVDAAAPGRQWLTAQFQAAGAMVDFVVVYQRRVPHFTAEQFKRMEDSRHDGSVWLFSSAEGLDSLPRLPQGDWSTARAIATHPRIAGAARDAGWGVVIESRPAVDDIVASIESLKP